MYEPVVSTELLYACRTVWQKYTALLEKPAALGITVYE